MPGLTYPFVFECSGCEAEVEVTRAEVTDLWPDPDSLEAVDVALKQEHGWTKDHRGAFCPQCDQGPEPVRKV
jgi:hypothetical protein